jgi:hypothetical protein
LLFHFPFFFSRPEHPSDAPAAFLSSFPLSLAAQNRNQLAVGSGFERFQLTNTDALLDIPPLFLLFPKALKGNADRLYHKGGKSTVFSPNHILYFGYDIDWKSNAFRFSGRNAWDFKLSHLDSPLFWVQ